MEIDESTQQNESLVNKEKENMEEDNEHTIEEETNNDESDHNTSREFNYTVDAYTSDDLIKNSTWKKGQLAWARMSIYPFWPCMITNDPNSLMTYQKVQTIGKSRTLMIHVHFFNDNGRHSWIPSHHMIPFNGIEDFRKRASLVTDVIRKKEPKFAAALTVKPNIFGTWQKAVAEAMDVLYELDMSPLEKFKAKLKDVTNNTVGRKRKRKDEDGKTVKKIMKTTNTNIELNESENINNASKSNAQVESDLNLETPPVSPPNEDDLRAATLQKQKRITKMINKLQPPDFEVYYERTFFSIKELYADTTDEQVREYLYDVWEKMAPEEKLKYRATYKIDKDSNL